MKVEVQLFATLAAYLPPDAHGDRVTSDVPDGATVADVLRPFRIPADLECLVVVNGVDVAPDQRLADGDVLSLFPPLAGGSEPVGENAFSPTKALTVGCSAFERRL